MSVTMSIIGMVLAIVILIVLMMKGVNQFLAILCASLAAILFSGQNVHEALTTTFVTGMTGYIKSYFFMFLWGALLSVFMEVSGGASSIAKMLMKVMKGWTWVAIPIATGLLAYGGVFAIAATFPVIPIARAVFKEHDIPRRLMPGMLYFGCGTCFMVAPGAVQVQNIVPASEFGLSRTCGFVGGWIGALSMLVIGLVWLHVMIKKERALGHHWVDDQEINDAERPLPHPLLALLPLIITIAAINLPDGSGGNLLPMETAVLIGDASCLLLLCKYFKWKELTSHFAKAAGSTTSTIFGISAIVGFGSVIKAVPGFAVLSDMIVRIPGTYLIGAALGTALICGFCGSASGGLGIAAPLFRQIYGAIPGVNAGAVARIMSLASCSLDSAPHSGAVTAIISLCGETHKESYLPVFYLSVVTPLIGTAIGILIFTLFPGLP